MARLIGASAACMLLVLLVASACATSAARANEPSGARIRQLSGAGAWRKVGGRTEVRNVEGDREVQELGRFSVDEHNRHRECYGGRLEFGRVVSAQRQVVSGIKYYLRVAAAEEGAGNGVGDREFDAVVVVKPWLESRTLLRFAPAATPNKYSLRLLMYDVSLTKVMHAGVK